ncbi:protein adenylyltransferase SelO [Bowmanella dokdonensis]|uniref:Protein nucleotidyltransferase YdiU n=1 Tax=Bowmanella dokdonensis TaxID=751969 RepID=A0A939DMX6_9ALTE|nr:YdiU family protein [Bowmanella dokdonensis]MBN7825724.1 YdiU family protein [Bowmanella dokdonensis]
MFLAHTYAKQLADLGSPVFVQKPQGAVLRHVNQSLLEDLDLDPELFTQSRLFHALFDETGRLNRLAMAQKYGGHQFGQWNPELGDGRGLLLAETKDSRGKPVDLHLKGAGQTPYSRFGDGRAVLRSTLREYLVGEAMHYLGIPSSRSLCLITSSEPVMRERRETAAMMIRTCQSHIRFGHFEYFYHSGQSGKLQRLFDYCFTYHFPELHDRDDKYQAMLGQIVLDTAELVAKWQAFGFAHGVMNTDNMSIHGISFDFGPYAFLDDFKQDFICNHSDHQGRYAFDNQPGIALWNLNALAHAFTPYLDVEALKNQLAKFEPRLLEHYFGLMAQKLGLQDKQEGDRALISAFIQQLHDEARDYHISFRLLSHYQPDKPQPLLDHFVDQTRTQAWLEQYSARLSAQEWSDEQRQASMRRHNPKYVLRNYLAQQAIEQAGEGDFREFETLFELLKHPYQEQPDKQAYAKAPPDWGKSLEISCSS